MTRYLLVTTTILLSGCYEPKVKPQQELPTHTDVFTYSDKKTGETIKYYGFKDLDTAIFYANRENKDILVIFSCYACMASGGQEWQTLSLFKDNDRIYGNFVIAWLAVDARRKAQDTSETVSWNGKQQRLATVGHKNLFLEISLYNWSAQPLFCFMDVDKKPFGSTMGYTRSEDQVEAFIYSGLAR